MRRRRPARLDSSAMSRAVRLRPALASSSSASRVAASASSPAASARSSRPLPGAPRRPRPRARRRRSARPRPGPRGRARSSSSRARSRSPAARRAAAAISSGRGRPALGGELGFEHLGRERREVDRLAARGDRLQQRLGLGAEQDQVDELGRLLERLQQRVLALVAHRLRRLDDEDALAAFEGPVGGGADHPLAHLLDQVLGAARGQPDEVGMRRGVEQGAAAGVVGVLGRRRRGSRRRRRARRRACRPRAGRGRGRRARGPTPAPRVSATRARAWCSVAHQASTIIAAPSLVRTASITRSWTSSTVPSASITTTRSLAMIAISS